MYRVGVPANQSSKTSGAGRTGPSPLERTMVMNSHVDARIDRRVIAFAIPPPRRDPAREVDAPRASRRPRGADGSSDWRCPPGARGPTRQRTGRPLRASRRSRQWSSGRGETPAFVGLIIGAVLCVAMTGCTHRQLAQSTVAATGTIMDIEYRLVLNNLALFSRHPEALPSHVRLTDGVVQVSDEAAFGTGGGFTTTGGRLDVDQFGPSARRNVSEQWGTEAVTDPQRLTGLQDLYRSAMGLPPLPPPETVAYLRRKSSGASSFASGSGGAASKPSTDSSPAGDDDRSVPIEVLLSDVPPPGWFHLGGRREVPKNACYVGRHGNRYAWVTPGGMAGLSRFTVAVLGAVKLDPGQSRRTRELTFTR